MQSAPKPRIRVKLLGDGFAFVQLSKRVATITQILKRPGRDGRRARTVAAYFGFDSEAAAKQFLAQSRRSSPQIYGLVRFSQRLETPWEVKIFGDSGERMAWYLLKSTASASSPTRLTPDPNWRANPYPQARAQPKRFANISID